jgi:SecD/SecF fusion protein
LTILGYSMYDTIIVFDRVRENMPRMPRAAFSQIVNRSMSEVLTRSLATTSCTLMPIIALLLFGGATLNDFAFALLIGVASGAYSSIFIASPVLTHWKEREPIYRARRHRIVGGLGYVPAYADGADVEPTPKRPRRSGRITAPEPETVSAADFEQMKRDLDIERTAPSRHTSTLTKRLARTADAEITGPLKRTGGGGSRSTGGAKRPPDRGSRPADGGSRPASGRPRPEGGVTRPADGGSQREDAVSPAADGGSQREDAVTPPAEGAPPVPAPDIAENEGVAPAPKPKGSAKPRSRNRRHGRRR